MMKFIFFALVLCIVLVAGDNTVYNIHHCSDFNALPSELSFVNIYLKRDINCEGGQIKSLAQFEQSLFEGNHHRIQNFSVQDGIFLAVQASTIQNVKFVDFTVSHYASDQGSTGLVAVATFNSAYINITLDAEDVHRYHWYHHDWHVRVAVRTAGKLVQEIRPRREYNYDHWFHHDEHEEYALNAVAGVGFVGGLTGTSHQTTFTNVVVRKTLVAGSNPYVGGVVGQVTGSVNVFDVVRNYGFEGVRGHWSDPIVVGQQNSVGGIAGDVQCSCFTQCGALAGTVVGQTQVGGLVGSATDVITVSQCFVRPDLYVIANGTTDTSAGGLFGTYKLTNSDNSYSIADSYSKATVSSLGGDGTVSSAGGLIGAADFDLNIPINIAFCRVYGFSQLTVGAGDNEGQIIGYLLYNPAVATFTDVFYSTDINAGDKAVGFVSTSRTAPLVKRASEDLTGISGHEYVHMVNDLIQSTDQTNVWCQDRLRTEGAFFQNHNVCRCGIFSPDFNGNCLCSHYTQLATNHSFCINSTLACTPQKYTYYVKNSDELYLDIQVEHVHFDWEGRLVVELSYAVMPTGWTDIIVTGEPSYTYISSLSAYLQGEDIVGNRGQEKWDQFIDKTETTCRQQSTFKLPWTQIALQAQDAPLSGNFSFFIFANTEIVREGTRAQLKRERTPAFVDPAHLITAVPLYLHLNTTITTNASIATNFTLNFDINIRYYVKAAYLDNTGFNLTVVIHTSVSDPFAIDFTTAAPTVSIANVAKKGPHHVLSATLVGSVPTVCEVPVPYDLDTFQRCGQDTTYYITLPYDFNCTEKDVDLTFTMALTCEGPNKNDSSTLCPDVYNELVVGGNKTNVSATVSILYSFCPEYQKTFLIPTSFALYEDEEHHDDHHDYHKKGELERWEDWDEKHLIHNNGEVHEYIELYSNMTFETIRSVNGSIFQSARITAVHIAEVVKSANSVRHVDVTSDVITWPGHLISSSPDVIKIAFKYYPDFELITTYLQNWYQGLYFYVEVDVSYAPPTQQKKSLKQEVRLQLQSSEMARVMGAARIERTNINSAPFTIKRGAQDVKPIAASPAKNTPVVNSNVNEELAKEAERAARMMSIIGASAGSAMLVVVACLIVVVTIMLKNKNVPATN